MTNQENIFRFISVRPTKLEKGESRLSMEVYNGKTKSTFYSHVVKTLSSGANKEDLSSMASAFKESTKYIKEFKETKVPIDKMIDWVMDNRHLTFKESKFETELAKVAKKSLVELLKDSDFQEYYTSLCDSVLADILTKTQVDEKEEKISAIKLLYTLKSVGEKTLSLPENELIQEYFGRSTVIFPLLKTEPNQEEEVIKENYSLSIEDEKNDEKESRRKKIAELETAHRELTNLAKSNTNRYIPEEKANENAQIKELENQIALLSMKCPDNESLKNTSFASSSQGLSHPAKETFILSRQAVNLLEDSSKKILNNFQFDIDMINPIQAVNRIEEEIKYLHQTQEADYPQEKMIALGGIYVDKEKYKASMKGGKPSAGHGYAKKCSFKTGIGDLLIVRQTLKAYELAEFAHVENALAGEFREKVHKRLDISEVITSTITESETEKERNLQSTERNEMQTEAEKILQQKANVDAGLQITGSYGPSISFAASMNAGFSTSIQETQSKSTSYSREVTEKTSEKVRSKVTEEIRRRVLNQIEESNTHRIDNTKDGAKHTRGIYRWLNKIYDAQIFNYGQRMMYEFVIPEPASFFLYATIENPPNDSEIVKPSLPTYPISGSSPLKPSHLTRTNYNDYVSKYNVLNAPEPPSSFTVKTYFDKQDGRDKLCLGRSTAISIPDGYEAFAAVVSSDNIWEQGNNHGFRVNVGGSFYDRTNTGGSHYQSFPRRYRGEVTVSVIFMDVWSFSLGVDVFCSLTDEAFAKWQLKMYNAIVQAYLDQKSVYDSKIAQREIQKGIEILGRNPIENRRIEKEELKKLIVMILTHDPTLNINSYTSSFEPIMNLAKVCSNGSFIRFFENAFEWENILYVLYPYFWGSHAKWTNAIHITDPDLDFAAFLKAGAARVQIPVRPGFEKAIAYYCQTGYIWEGNDVPLIGDDLYVPIINEITENLGKLDDGVPYPKNSTPWKVTIPTSLVVLQDLSEISAINDMMTGNPININP